MTAGEMVERRVDGGSERAPLWGFQRGSDRHNGGVRRRLENCEDLCACEDEVKGRL